MKAPEDQAHSQGMLRPSSAEREQPFRWDLKVTHLHGKPRPEQKASFQFAMVRTLISEIAQIVSQTPTVRMRESGAICASAVVVTPDSKRRLSFSKMIHPELSCSLFCLYVCHNGIDTSVRFSWSFLQQQILFCDVRNTFPQPPPFPPTHHLRTSRKKSEKIELGCSILPKQ